MARSANTRVAINLASVVALMASLSFAAVPFYSWFCRVTGYGGATAVADGPSDAIVDRWVTVRFDANTDPAMPWRFRPTQREVRVRLGQTGLAFYEAYNPTDRAVAGQAAYNVAPDAAGKYFDKIACFCFVRQVLEPGERIEMPVSFYVDPEMLEDGDASRITSITLSYTMFEADLPEVEQSSAPLPAARVAAGPATTRAQTIEQ